MAVYTKRVQTVLTKEQYERLIALAEEAQKPVSVLIREAVEERYFVKIDQQKRQQALANLLALNAPVADWPQMEEEIERGALDE
ncbi:MAG: ribbon-helix-helix protein, CopG family [Ardenticatenaceae bacterium]|nr:ribbon-helix-helix protein, CopG family [Ardenticatenaceae bacterium]